MRPISDTMHLRKHHGLGNDFLILVDLDDHRPVDAAAARLLCDRHRGVGADGFIRVSPAPAGGPATDDDDRADAAGLADVAMTLHNADGSMAEMSGNGIRCLGQAVARQRGVASLDLVVATAGGLRRLQVHPGPADDPATAWVTVDMGPARAGPESVALPVPGDVTKVATVDMGNPHLVLLVDDPATVDLAALGPQLSSRFEHGSNVEVVTPTPGRLDTLELRVWERGVGLTQACGTGACAAAHAAHAWGMVGERVRVRMPGGEVDVALGATVTLSGPATFVADIYIGRSEMPR